MSSGLFELCRGAVEGHLSDRYIFPYIVEMGEGEEYNEDTMASKQKHID